MDKKIKLLVTATILTMPLVACNNNGSSSTGPSTTTTPPSPISSVLPPSTTTTPPISSSNGGGSTTSSTTPTPPEPVLTLSTHAEYMEAENNTPIKIAGKATYVYTNAEKEITGAFLQNGTGGFYLYGIPAEYTVEVGKNYEVIGAKGYYNGMREVKDITSVTEVSTAYTVETKDVSAMTLTDEGMSEYHGGYVTIEGTVPVAPTVSTTKAYSVTMSVAGGSIDLRVDPSYYTTADQYQALNTLFSGIKANQKLQAKGIMTSFGYSSSKLSAQMLLTSATDITLAALSDAEICDNVAASLPLPYVIEKDVNSITLPTAQEGTTIAWTSDNAAIGVDGTVTHGAADATVHLKATVTKGTASAEKSYTVIVIGTEQQETVLAYTGFEDPNPVNSYGQSSLKGGYKGAEVTLDGHSWYLDEALLGNSSSDKKIDKWSCRQKPKASGGATYTMFDVVDLTYVDFYAGTYGTKAPAKIIVSYSTDSGATWTAAETDLMTAEELQHYRVYLNLTSEHCRVKFEFDVVGSHNQCLDEVNLVHVGA